MTDNPYEEHEKNMLKLFNCVPENLKWGQYVYTDCPCCGAKGDLFISRSGYNGHLHIFCKNCERGIIQ